MSTCTALSKGFFETTLPFSHLTGIYDLRLVVMSYAVAVFASYVALDLTARLRDRNNTNASILLWLVGGAIAMGAGIWSMHFIGMLSFSIPGLALQYDPFWTAISLIVAIFASGFALFLLKATLINVVHLIAGGVILGIAIASMHYTGMEAMLITLNIRYLPGLFFTSILVAVVASEAAIWLAIKSTQVVIKMRTRMKMISALIMGFAICGMHYTGMAASIFTPLCTATTNQTAIIDPAILAMAITAVTFVILSIAFLASTYKEAINLQQFERARQLGMAEISASVLHNAGNVLNSVLVSANMIAENKPAKKLAGLEKLCTMLNEHEDNLGEFITNDPRGKKVLQYLNEYSKAQRAETDSVSNEISSLLNNVTIIKEIIATQQELSKTQTIDNIISVNDLLNEALLITGLDLKKEIHIHKHYANLDAIVTDKVKLLQIFVNVLLNAKDALVISDNAQKTISITTSSVNNKIIVKITDSGVGISAKELKKIFSYGYTTKKSGHGFGLHTCSLAINELGGELHIDSDGINKGATCIIEIPYRRQR